MLPAIITQLEQLIAQVKASGPVAAEKARLDISTHATSGYDYARLRNGRQLKSCGRVGGEKYLEETGERQQTDLHTRQNQASLSDPCGLRQRQSRRVAHPCAVWSHPSATGWAGNSQCMTMA